MFARWDRMAKQFARIAKDINIAVKAGGSDPNSNPALRRAVQNSRALNMPKDKVEAAIKRAAGKDAANYEQIIYEGYAPHGVAIIGIYDKGPAALAGLKPGDVLFTLDGKPIASQLELRNHEASLAPGTQVQLTGERNGTPFSLAVSLQERPQRQTSG